ncbi:DUF4221 domain-containing protein [Sphingobacteriales bacterium UPWRP_1]|nr:hypothetical protein B6N25_04970 [Sphingobacteriales bacterium TSM_CSS]PSJ78312.1 DUF4221 domain-containing protein [Sphingobacteriales bacterium UPWRP_1]
MPPIFNTCNFSYFMVNLKSIIILLLFVVILKGCSQSGFNIHNVKAIKTLQNAGSLTFRFDSISTKNIDFKSYSCSSISALTISDSACLVLRNNTNNTLDVYNLESDKFMYTIDVPVDYRVCEDMNSTFIKGNSVYHLENKDGAFYTATLADKKLNLNTYVNANKTMLDKKLINLTLSGLTQIYVTSDSLLFFTVGNPFGAKVYPITAELNLKTNEIKEIGIKQPMFLYKNDFGLSRPIQQLYADDFILYACNALPEIWKFNLRDNTILRYICRSSFQTDSILPLPFRSNPYNKDRAFDIFMHSARYEKLIYDEYRNLYYRFFILPMPQKNEQGFFNTYKDRQISVMVLDENFNLMGETLLPKMCFGLFLVATSKQGLFINYGPFSKAMGNEYNILKITFTKN